MNNYQIMPTLSDEEYQSLKEDISKRGVMIPIEYDENGNVLDGHHRLKICDELGMQDFPKVVRTGLTETEKRTHARQLNLLRRHLSQEQKRQLIQEQLKETPEKSDRQIATSLGVSDKTVGTQRRELESTAEIPQLATNIGADGKERPRQVQRQEPIAEIPQPQKSEPMLLLPQKQSEEIHEEEPQQPYNPSPIDFSTEAEEPKEDPQAKIPETIPTPNQGFTLYKNGQEVQSPKNISLEEKKREEDRAFDKKLDLGDKVYKELSNIYLKILDFEITDERMEALLENFDENLTIREHIEEIDENIQKLQKIKSFLVREEYKRGQHKQRR